MNDIKYLLNEISNKDVKQYQRLHKKLINNFGHIINVGLDKNDADKSGRKTLEQSILHFKVYNDDNLTKIGMYSNMLVRFLNSISSSPFKRAFIILSIIYIYYILGLDVEFIMDVMKTMSGYEIQSPIIIKNIYLPYLSNGSVTK